MRLSEPHCPPRLRRAIPGTTKTMREGSASPARIDWRGWIALTWALTFAVLYAGMLWKERGPKALKAVAAVVRVLGR